MKENLDIIEVFCCVRGGVTIKLLLQIRYKWIDKEVSEIKSKEMLLKS